MTTGAAATAAVALLLPAAGAYAQEAPSAAALPPLAAPKPLTLPKVTQETLPNGLRLVVLENRNQPAVWFRLAMPAGAIRDTPEKVGLATMVADMLDKGTTTRTESQIADTVDGLGASLGASADDDYLFVSASGLSPYADTLLELLADITLNPTFPEAEAERYRARTLGGIQASLADAGTVASAALARAVYGAHPYGNFSTGTPKTVPNLQVADLKGFHQRYFAPNGATLFVAGDITAAQARQKVEKAFGSWGRKVVPPLPAAPKSPSQKRIVIVDRPGAAQTEIRIGQQTPGYADPSRIPFQVSSVLLGGGFESRLSKEIRVKRGLTYGVSASNRRNRDAGLFSIGTFTKNESTGEVVQLSLAEMKSLRDTAPTPTELGERKTLLTGLFALGVATPEGVLTRLIPATLYGGGVQDLAAYTQRVTAVTPEDVRKVFQSLPEEASTVVLVGDAKAIQPQVAGMGTVTVIPQEALDLNAPDLGAGAAKPATP